MFIAFPYKTWEHFKHKLPEFASILQLHVSREQNFSFQLVRKPKRETWNTVTIHIPILVHVLYLMRYASFSKLLKLRNFFPHSNMTTTTTIYNLICLHTDYFKFTCGDVKLKSTFNVYFSASAFLPYNYLTLNNINKSIYESYGHCVPLRPMKPLCLSPFII